LNIYETIVIHAHVKLFEKFSSLSSEAIQEDRRIDVPGQPGPKSF
jgi:hypothetical protein